MTYLTSTKSIELAFVYVDGSAATVRERKEVFDRWLADHDRGITSKTLEFNETQINAGAVALMRDDPEAENGTYGFEDYREMVKAVLNAVFAYEDKKEA